MVWLGLVTAVVFFLATGAVAYFNFQTLKADSASSYTVVTRLLGLHNKEGLLDHVGFTSTITNEERSALTRKLQALEASPGFTGRAPGGPSRWSTERSGAWKPLRPELVVEVRYDHVTSDQFRHGTKLLRWRPDKPPQGGVRAKFRTAWVC